MNRATSSVRLIMIMYSVDLTTLPGLESKARQNNTGSEQWSAEKKQEYALQQKLKAQQASSESSEALDIPQRRADARAAAKLAWSEESEGVAEILKEEGLLNEDAMQQLDVLV